MQKGSIGVHYDFNFDTFAYELRILDCMILIHPPSLFKGVPPPHQREPSSKKSHGDHINRLRKFIAKPSAGLRIRIHPTLQSEQIGVVPVEGTINIVDEFHNSDGVWVRLGQESLLEFANVPNYSEGKILVRFYIENVR